MRVLTLECIGGREDGRLMKVPEGVGVVLFAETVPTSWGGDDGYDLGDRLRVVACPVRRRVTGELAIDTSKLR